MPEALPPTIEPGLGGLLAFNLTFGDYILVAVVHAIMLGITTAEAATPKGDEASERCHRIAGTAAFSGLFASVVLAYFVGGTMWPPLGEAGSLLFPLSTMAWWFVYHRRASKVIDFEEFESHINADLQEEILKVVSEADDDGLHADRIHERLAERYTLARRVTATLPFLPRGPMGRLAMRVLGSVQDVFLTKERVDNRLMALVDDGKLNRFGEGDETVYRRAYPISRKQKLLSRNHWARLFSRKRH